MRKAYYSLTFYFKLADFMKEFIGHCYIIYNSEIINNLYLIEKSIIQNWENSKIEESKKMKVLKIESMSELMFLICENLII